MDQTQSDAEVLSRFVTYEPAPGGFDPKTASDHLLRKHGFPRRPDPRSEAEMHQLWEEAFSRPMQMIKAELTVDRARPNRERLQPTRPFDVAGGWAGAIVNP